METETPTVSLPPKQKRKPAKKRARVVSNQLPKAAKGSEFEGITPADCPMACTAQRCIISGRGICSHPYKGGLQANLQNPDSLRRYNGAKRALGKRKLDLTEDQ